jgi:alpha-L-rhamnosidase
MPGGWTLAGFHPPEAPAAAAWVQPSSRNASSLSLSSAHLRPKPTLALALQEAVKPATFSQVGPGAWFADFGHEVMGGLSLRVNLVAFPPGSRLQLTLGEELVGDPKNSTTILYPMRTGNTYRHVWTVGRHSAGGGEAAGSGGEVGGAGGGASQASFENHEYMVFRYASILVLGHGTSHPLKGAAGSAATDELTLTAWTVSYPWVEDESSFSSSMPELDQVWRLARDTLRVTSLDTTTDSNTRERLPYEADGYITGLSRLALQSDVQWPRHSSRHNIVNPTWPTEWRQTVSLLALIDWMHVGGPEPALYAEFGAAMVEQTQAACIEPTTGLVDFKSCARRTGGFGAGSEARLRDIVDWPEAARDGYNLTNVNTVVNAYTAGGLRALAELADASGDAAGANALRQKASRVTNAINARLFDPKAGLYVDGADDSGAPIEHTSWHASVFPAAFGLVPRERWPSLLSMFDRRGMVGSVYAAFWFLRALYALESDGGQLALQVLTSCAKNSWCNMIAQGATATMEAWTPDEKPNLSWSHPWASAPASAVAWGLMGIRPTKPAFEELIVRPQPGNLSSAKIKVPTRRGPVIAQIRQEFARGPSVPQQRGATPMTFTLTLSVPVTSSATVCLPRLGSASPDILLDGKRIRGVLEDDFVCVAQIGSSAEPHVLVRQA